MTAAHRSSPKEIALHVPEVIDERQEGADMSIRLGRAGAADRLRALARSSD
jgi:hypothetical protein